jgi:hypothetical protein
MIEPSAENHYQGIPSNDIDQAFCQRGAFAFLQLDDKYPTVAPSDKHFTMLCGLLQKGRQFLARCGNCKNSHPVEPYLTAGNSSRTIHRKMTSIGSCWCVMHSRRAPSIRV